MAKSIFTVGWGSFRRKNRPTEKQLRLIQDMQDNSDFSLPEFTGTTKEEAHKYIENNWELAHTNSWSIEHGY